MPAADQELRFERLLADLSADFVNLEAEAVLSRIEGALEQIVRFFGVDRSSFFEFVDAEGRAEIRASWAMPGVESSPPGRVSVHFPWYARSLWRGETIVLPRLPEGLPEQAVAERDYVARSGMKSNLTFPLLVEGRPFGFIALGLVPPPGRLLRRGDPAPAPGRRGARRLPRAGARGDLGCAS